jgi:hypothetical protein
MRKIALMSFISLFLSGLTGYSFGQIFSNKQKSTIEKQVDSAFHKMINVAESLDYDSLNKGVDDKFQAGFITNGIYYSTFDSLILDMKSKAHGLKGQTITIQKEKITVLSESVVLLTATGIAKVDTTSGNQFTINFFWTFVYEKINGSWKVIQSHQSINR